MPYRREHDWSLSHQRQTVHVLVSDQALQDLDSPPDYSVDRLNAYRSLIEEIASEKHTDGEQDPMEPFASRPRMSAETGPITHKSRNGLRNFAEAVFDHAGEGHPCLCDGHIMGLGVRIVRGAAQPQALCGMLSVFGGRTHLTPRAP
jgi:hypothetical protein